MVFNPIFFDSANNGSEINFFAKPQKIGESHYLFANILNVYANNTVGAQNKNIGNKASAETDKVSDVIEQLFGSAESLANCGSAEKMIGEKDFAKLLSSLESLFGQQTNTEEIISSVKNGKTKKVFALSDENKFLMFSAEEKGKGKFLIKAFASEKSNGKIQKQLSDFIQSVSADNENLEKVFESDSDGKSKIKIFELKNTLPEMENVANEVGKTFDKKLWGEFTSENKKKNVVRALDEKKVKTTEENGENKIVAQIIPILNRLQENGNLPDVEKQQVVNEITATLEDEIKVLQKSGEKINKVTAMLNDVGFSLGKGEKIDYAAKLSEVKNAIAEIKSDLSKSDGTEKTIPSFETEKIAQDIRELNDFIGTVKISKQNTSTVVGEIKAKFSAIKSETEKLDFQSQNKKEIPVETKQAIFDTQKKLDKIISDISANDSKPRFVAGKLKEMKSELETLNKEVLQITDESKKSVLPNAEAVKKGKAPTEKTMASSTKNVTIKNSVTKIFETPKEITQSVKEKLDSIEKEIVKFSDSLKNISVDENSKTAIADAVKKLSLLGDEVTRSAKEMTAVVSTVKNTRKNNDANNIAKETARVKNEIPGNEKISVHANKESGKEQHRDFSDGGRENAYKHADGDENVKIKNEPINDFAAKSAGKQFVHLENHIAKETMKMQVVDKNDVIKRLANFIQKQEKTTLEFQLNPEHLGKVKVALDLTNDIVKANITVETHHAKALLESNLNELYSQINKSGIQFNEVNISLAQNWQRQEKHTKAGNKGFGKNTKFNKVSDVDELDGNLPKEARMFGYNTYEYLA